MLHTYYKLQTILFSLIAILLLGFWPAAAAENSPAGLWKAFDDHTHKARGTVRIYEENGTFFGRIESSFNPEEMTARCDKCSGDRKHAPVIGMVILRGMTQHGGDYEGGDILDPETGSVYRCLLTLSRDGQHLQVRGFLGFSIFGRTQTWTRMEEESQSNVSVTNGHSVASLGTEGTK